jgi:hypothetical protein
MLNWPYDEDWLPEDEEGSYSEDYDQYGNDDWSDYGFSVEEEPLFEEDSY